MARKSRIFTKNDIAGDYEVEIFDNPSPVRVIVCLHGSGVRRWDGEKFFNAVAEHYTDSTVMLVDQNQEEGEYIKMNPLPVLVGRVNGLMQDAKQLYAHVPIVLMGHSMGCGVATFLDASAVVLVTPAVGNVVQNYKESYGDDIVAGKQVITSDGFKKYFTAEFISSVKNITWDDEYRKFIEKYKMPVYVFEAGDDNVLGDDRFSLRTIRFKKYVILKDAKHNLTDGPLKDFFANLDELL